MTYYTEAHIKAQKKSDKKNVKSITFRFSRNTDKDILDKFEAVPNVQGYVKQLIRDDLKKEK